MLWKYRFAINLQKNPHQLWWGIWYELVRQLGVFTSKEIVAVVQHKYFQGNSKSSADQSHYRRLWGLSVDSRVGSIDWLLTNLRQDFRFVPRFHRVWNIDRFHSSILRQCFQFQGYLLIQSYFAGGKLWVEGQWWSLLGGVGRQLPLRRLSGPDGLPIKFIRVESIIAKYFKGMRLKRMTDDLLELWSLWSCKCFGFLLGVVPSIKFPLVHWSQPINIHFSKG